MNFCNSVIFAVCITGALAAKYRKCEAGNRINQYSWTWINSIIHCSISVFFFSFFIWRLSAAGLSRCEAGDTGCLVNIMNEYIESYHKGLRSLNLVSLDPLFIEKVDIIQSRESPVNVNLNFKNVTMFGLSSMKVYKVVYVSEINSDWSYCLGFVLKIVLNFKIFSGFDKDPSTSKFEIYGKVNRLALIGQYRIKGSVIILPVTGSGASNFTFGM